MTVKELFDSGNLDGAIEALTKEVKANPNDAVRRTFFFELLSFSGQLDRAAKQLEVIAHQDFENEMAAQVYINLLHAEGLRARLYSEGLRARVLARSPPYVHLHLEAIKCLRATAGYAHSSMAELTVVMTSALFLMAWWDCGTPWRGAAMAVALGAAVLCRETLLAFLVLGQNRCGGCPGTPGGEWCSRSSPRSPCAPCS